MNRSATRAQTKLQKLLSWERLIAQGIERAGFDKKQAGALAEFTLSSIEGALILCRTRRSIEPLERVGQRIESILSTAKRGRRT